MTNAALSRDDVGRPLPIIDSGEVGSEYTRSPDSSAIEGDANSYTINYLNGVVEVGGIKQVQANPVTSGIIEGVVSIPLPLSTVLNAQATAMNVTEAPGTLNGERAHIAVEGTTLKVYVSANANSSATIPVSWTVKGNK